MTIAIFEIEDDESPGRERLFCHLICLSCNWQAIYMEKAEAEAAAEGHKCVTHLRAANYQQN